MWKDLRAGGGKVHLGQIPLRDVHSPPQIP
jgi:hypothetical protein